MLNMIIADVKCNFCGITGHYARCCRHKAETRKHQHKAKVKQLLVDTDSDNVSFKRELLMCRKLRSTVPAQANVLQPKLPNAVGPTYPTERSGVESVV